MRPIDTSAEIRAQVAVALRRAPKARAIGIHTSAPIPTEGRFTIDNMVLPVVQAGSVLELREHLAPRTADDPPLVVLTNLSDREIGTDALALFAKRRILTIDSWQLVKAAFRAKNVDPTTQDLKWLPRMLLEIEAERGVTPVRSGFLDAETTWRTVFQGRLGTPGGARDAAALLEWSLQPETAARLAGLEPEIRDGLSEAVRTTAGALATLLFGCVLRGNGEDLVSSGLVLGVLMAAAEDGDVIATKGLGKLESRLGLDDLPPDLASLWALESQGLVERKLTRFGMSEVRGVLARADALLDQLGVRGLGVRSRYLAAGYEQRYEAFALALGALVANPGSAAAASIEGSASEVAAHVLTATDATRKGRFEMAVRLARWLAVAAAANATASSFSAAATQYRQDGSFVDWARKWIADGDTNPVVQRAYAELWRAVLTRREMENERFAKLLVGWTQDGSHDDTVIPVEDVLTRVLAPLAKQKPVLFVVVDGMSGSVFRELQGDLLERAWTELVPEGRGTMPPVIAAVPSLTEVSRASLLAGSLSSGASSLEKDLFPKQASLVAVCETNKLPVLFHKGDLRDTDGVGLASVVTDAITDSRRCVVGVVINAVDDHLAKGEQTRVVWTLPRIRPLEELLDLAVQAGRLVVLVSDHGHVLEHDSTLVRQGESDRWRPADSPPTAGEVEIAGPRVPLSAGGRIIAAWSERLRYGLKKHGYHGGASPQEMVIPLGVFLPPGQEALPSGYVEAGDEEPTWWIGIEELPAVAAAETPAKPRPRRVRAQPGQAPGEQGILFGPADETEEASAPVVSGDVRATGGAVEWIERLLASSTMVEQRARAARTNLPDERIREILTVLDERGGKLTRPALARRTGVPGPRLANLLTVLRRLLNVEGYPVLTVDESSDTVELNRSLLETQFGLNAEVACSAAVEPRER